MVYPIRIWWVLRGVPFFWPWKFPVQARFDLALVVDTVEAHNALEKDVEFGVAVGIFGDLVERLENIDYDLLERLHLPSGFVHAVQSRHLDEPSYILKGE